MDILIAIVSAAVTVAAAWIAAGGIESRLIRSAKSLRDAAEDSDGELKARLLAAAEADLQRVLELRSTRTKFRTGVIGVITMAGVVVALKYWSIPAAAQERPEFVPLLKLEGIALVLIGMPMLAMVTYDALRRAELIPKLQRPRRRGRGS